jgi:hypothetical protein
MSDDVRMMFESKYLGAWDFPKPAVGTIERVVGATIEGEGGRKDKAPLIYFKGVARPMVCNKTNLKTIASIVGSFRASDWIGKRVTLYATKCKGKAGGEVDCVRVRPKAPAAADPPITPQPVDPAMREAQKREAGETSTADRGDAYEEPT